MSLNKLYTEKIAMGSLSAMSDGSADRYFQNNKDQKLVPEGIQAFAINLQTDIASVTDLQHWINRRK